MVDLQIVIDFMLQNFQHVKITNNGMHFLCRCPMCGDSKKSQYKRRFNLDYNNGVPGWHCFNCDEQGNFIELYSRIKGISYNDAKREVIKYDGSYFKKKLNGYQKRPNDNTDDKEVEYDDFNWIKKYCYSLSSDNKKEIGILEKKYLNELKKFYENRKIPIEYKIYICYWDRYKNRFIIPIFNEIRRIIYFQARRIPGTGLRPKYDNPVSPKELCILNKHRFDNNKSIIVTEGLIDAFMVENYQGTSCLGKEISEEFLKELFNYTNEDVIICLDNDGEAYKSLSKFITKNKYAKKVKYFLYPKKFQSYKDINNISVKYKNLNIYDLIIKNSVNHFAAESILKLKKLI